MKKAQVGERVSDGTNHGTVLDRDPWSYLLRVRWDSGGEATIHEMYVEPSRVPRPLHQGPVHFVLPSVEAPFALPPSTPSNHEA